MNACLKKRRPVPVSATSCSGFGFPVARLGFWTGLPLFLSEIHLAGIIAQAVIAVKRKNILPALFRKAPFFGENPTERQTPIKTAKRRICTHVAAFGAMKIAITSYKNPAPQMLRCRILLYKFIIFYSNPPFLSRVLLAYGCPAVQISRRKAPKT